jgi:hypothetical protein
MKAYGTFRIYYNRNVDDPLVCSVSLAGEPIGGAPPWELLVRGVCLNGVEASTVYRPKTPTPGQEDWLPSFWLEATGTLDALGSGFVIIGPCQHDGPRGVTASHPQRPVCLLCRDVVE